MCSISSKNFWSALRRSGSENPLLWSSNPVSASGAAAGASPREWAKTLSRTAPPARKKISDVRFIDRTSRSQRYRIKILTLRSAVNPTPRLFYGNRELSDSSFGTGQVWSRERFRKLGVRKARFLEQRRRMEYRRFVSESECRASLRRGY